MAPKSFWGHLQLTRQMLWTCFILRFYYGSLTDLRNSFHFRLRASDGQAFSFVHNLFFFLILLRISLVIHGGLIIFFTVKAGADPGFFQNGVVSMRVQSKRPRAKGM